MARVRFASRHCNGGAPSGRRHALPSATCGAVAIVRTRVPPRCYLPGFACGSSASRPLLRCDIGYAAVDRVRFEKRFKEVLSVRVKVNAVDRGATDRYTGTSTLSKIKRLVDRR